ncbi:MAG TPA: metallophosphoesterase [Lacipirellulaceae bacterium]|nr:metallophosphoesterase [Lacipirellulaceae bacterium]
MAVPLLILGAIGHTVLWIALINRVHAIAFARRWINALTLLFLALLVFAPLAVAAALYFHYANDSPTSRFFAFFAWGYLALCTGVCLLSAAQRIYLAGHTERAAAPANNHTQRINLRSELATFAAPGFPTLLSRLPGNQVLTIYAQEKQIVIPRLAPAHVGLRIAHLTDLHMSGRFTQAFFERVVEAVNATSPDLIAITGDIVEGDRFLTWLPPTLGKLRARNGVYYVLGNHDRRATESHIKSILAEQRLIHVGHEWKKVIVHGAPLIVAGNELPWFKPAADFSACPSNTADGWATRILLAHSPDQFQWAQRNDCDLMLAGHLHGGQWRLPIIGAVTSPSAHGVRYAAGVFRAGNTVMHVSRGVGGLTPLRINCPPEIATLVLRAKA